METTIGTTVKSTNTETSSVQVSDKEWVINILRADNLRLSGASQSETLGRAELGKGTRILMWAMRVYVVLSFVLIVAQIYISLHSK